MTVEEVVQATPEQTAADVQQAYDKIANPDKVQEAEPVKEVIEIQPTETPPEPQEMADIRKRLDDVNGRYGRLSQKLDDVLTRLATPAKTQETAADDAVDVEELLKDVKEAFGEDEIYTSLKGAFSKVLANKSVDPDSVGKIVTERMAAARESEIQASLKQLVGDTENPGRHPDFFEVRETPEFAEWKKTLSPRDRSLFSRSEDPDYVADMLDEFKEWGKAKKLATETPPPKPDGHQKIKPRLAAAVLPTSGTNIPPKGEEGVYDKNAVRAAYDKVAGKRL